MLQKRDVVYAFDLGHADPLAKIADRLGRVAAAPQPADRGHPRIVPSAYLPLFDQFQQPPLAHHRVGQVQAGRTRSAAGRKCPAT